ncbi:hypothetical protein BC938DRAFT_471642 [Jimgerdemannia flammicorona]|uniref:Leucine-rich repeat-containing protein 40 n=1 Tax=Jimgerdemannia flammicorona TaxID=994334 RepID=A0A433QZY4_9FUNG|nr:hypothetical protein BC938DRAFT_471642 [Jimgerdemannia flammicorona]
MFGVHSGRLNISNRSLTLIPNAVWDMYHTDTKAINIDFNSSGGDAWYETIDLTKFIAADNAIEEISPRIGEEFLGLTVFDVCLFIIYCCLRVGNVPISMGGDCEILSPIHNNKISTLPREFGQLEHITQLNIAHNRLTTMPSPIFQLKALNELHLAGNQIESVDPQIGRLTRIEYLDLSQNHLTGLPEEIGDLLNLKKLKLSKNRLAALPSAEVLARLTKLAEFEAAENQLTVAFRGFGQSFDNVTFPTLHYLDLRQNKITRIDDAPQPKNFDSGNATANSSSLFRPPVLLPKLKELLLARNQLASLGPLLHTCPDLVTLDLQGNKFVEIPDGLLTLRTLNRLDVAGNLLPHLPAELGLLESLSVLTWEGNPIKNAPKVGRSTTELLKSLRDRLAADPGLCKIFNPCALSLENSAM